MGAEREIKYSCVVDTTYALSLYLLYQSDEVIKKTIFFVGNAIPQSISALLPYVVRIDNSIENYTRWGILKHRLEALIKWRCRNKTIMYAQDHLAYSAHIIGRNKYILLEDAPNIYTMYRTIKFMKPVPPNSISHRIKDFILWGTIGKRRLGTNSQCINRLVTSPSDTESELLKNKDFILVNLKELWNKSNEAKKRYIMDLFGISSYMFESVKKSNVILFSQPLLTDCGLSEDEMYNIYSPYIEKYVKDGVVVKPHPRDKFDYKKRFPDIFVLDCIAPMQLLCAMGMDFKVAITVCSSAISSLSKETEIVWIGSSIHSKIQKVYGDMKCPR